MLICVLDRLEHGIMSETAGHISVCVPCRPCRLLRVKAEESDDVPSTQSTERRSYY